MAGHARYTAVLDACVLYSQALSDALMSLASNGASRKAVMSASVRRKATTTKPAPTVKASIRARYTAMFYPS